MKHNLFLFLFTNVFICLFSQNLQSKNQVLLDSVSKKIISKNSLYYDELVEIFGENPKDTLNIKLYKPSLKFYGYSALGIFFEDNSRFAQPDRISGYFLDCQNFDYTWQNLELKRANMADFLRLINKRKALKNKGIRVEISNNYLIIRNLPIIKPGFSFYSEELNSDNLKLLNEIIIDNSFDAKKIYTKKYKSILKKIRVAYLHEFGRSVPLIEAEALEQ